MTIYGLSNFGITLFAVMTTHSAMADDFTGMTDVEVLLQRDDPAAMAEIQRRTKDYTQEEIRALEQAYFKAKLTPRPEEERSVEEEFERINQEPDGLTQMRHFRALHEPYLEKGEAEQAAHREAFQAGWAAASVVAIDGGDARESRMRYRNYAFQAERYFTSEETLLPLLVERCLEVEAFDGRYLFLDAIQRTKVPLGAATAQRLEALFGEYSAEWKSELSTCNVYSRILELHRGLGNCGEAGIAVVQRLGYVTFQPGFIALGRNRAPEAEALLWEMYGDTPGNQDRRRLELLWAIARKETGTSLEITARRDRVREELSRYLSLPEGPVNLGDIGSAVSLAEATRDPYFLPRVNALAQEFRALSPESYESPGMEERMDEAVATLEKKFDDALARLSALAVAEHAE